jgi:hypothetical protein
MTVRSVPSTSMSSSDDKTAFPRQTFDHSFGLPRTSVHNFYDAPSSDEEDGENFDKPCRKPFSPNEFLRDKSANAAHFLQLF